MSIDSPFLFFFSEGVFQQPVPCLLHLRNDTECKYVNQCGFEKQSIKHIKHEKPAGDETGICWQTVNTMSQALP